MSGLVEVALRWLDRRCFAGGRVTSGASTGIADLLRLAIWSTRGFAGQRLVLAWQVLRLKIIQSCVELLDDDDDDIC